MRVRFWQRRRGARRGSVRPATTVALAFAAGLGMAAVPAAADILYVTDFTANNVYQVDASVAGGSLVNFIPSFSSPIAIAIAASAGHIVVDGIGGAPKIYNTSGTLVGQFSQAVSIAFGMTTDAGGNYLVADSSGYLSTPQGLAVGPDGTAYVSSRGYGNVTKYSNAGVYEGVFVANVTDAYGLVVNATGTVFLASSAAATRSWHMTVPAPC